MHRFPKCSVLPDYSFVKYNFGTGLGYHVESPSSKALLSSLSSLISNSSTLKDAVLPTRTPDDDDDDDTEKQHDKSPLDYIHSLMRHHNRQRHSVMNINRQDMYDIDQFLTSIELTLNPESYESIVCTANGGRHRSQFQRLPFQQFMMLDSIFTMVNRSGLSEYRHQIFMYIKDYLGYGWLTWTKADILQQLFSARVVAHNIRRRMGKSVAVYAELARCLAFFPRAGIKALYTVHMAHSAEQCYTAVSHVIHSLVAYFNSTQRSKYTEKRLARGGSVDVNDFYYIAKPHTSRATKTIAVAFSKYNYMNICVQTSENTLLCKAYTQRDVSIIISSLHTK